MLLGNLSQAVAKNVVWSKVSQSKVPAVSPGGQAFSFRG